MTKSQDSPQGPKQPSTPRTPRFGRYRRSETARLLRGAADAGRSVRGLEVDPTTGALRILFDNPGAPPELRDSDFDRWMTKKAKDANQS
jgi:hypothetical protein